MDGVAEYMAEVYSESLRRNIHTRISAFIRRQPGKELADGAQKTLGLRYL